MDVSTEHQEYLNEHRFGVLSTGRKDGSPQASMVGVFFDGSDFLVTFRRAEREDTTTSAVNPAWRSACPTAVDP